jgi:hypothetical protein
MFSSFFPGGWAIMPPMQNQTRKKRLHTEKTSITAR